MQRDLDVLLQATLDARRMRVIVVLLHISYLEETKQQRLTSLRLWCDLWCQHRDNERQRLPFNGVLKSSDIETILLWLMPAVSRCAVPCMNWGIRIRFDKNHRIRTVSRTMLWIVRLLRRESRSFRVHWQLIEFLVDVKSYVHYSVLPIHDKYREIIGINKYNCR